MAPEAFLCTECRERVDLDQQEYVVTNRETARTTDNRLYAHLACARGKGKPLQDVTETEVEAIHRRILSELDEETMQRLGIQRIRKEP